MITSFLEHAGWSGADRTPFAPDASSRRYWRVQAGARSAVLMVANVETPEGQESLAAFRRISNHLRGLGLSAPAEYASSIQTGHLLLEDLGDVSLAGLIENEAKDASGAYECAAEGLAHIASAAPAEGVKALGSEGLASLVELTFSLVPDANDLRERLLIALSEAIATHASGPSSLSLRDVHGDNLMWLPDRNGVAGIGWLDFQDAVVLPNGYDLASLIDDPRRVVPRHLANDLIRAHSDARRNAVLSLARNLRILGIFHRLAAIHSKPVYRDFLPRTRELIVERLADLPGLRAPVTELLDRTAGWQM